MPRAAVSDAGLARAAARLRALHLTLELGVFLLVAGSVAAFGSVHPAAYTRVGIGCLGLGMLALARSVVAARLRRALGPVRLALDAGGRWSAAPAASAAGPARWSCDLGRRVPRAPLLVPGACFIAWVAFQLVPLPPELLGVLSPGRVSIETGSADAWLPLSVSAHDTRRGLAFVVAALLAHLAAGAALAGAGARARFQRALSLLGLALSLLGLVQLAHGTTRIYGVFEPHEGGGSIFGPFVNRNHFAGYMLMVIPVAFAVFARALDAAAAEAGKRRGWRGLAQALDTRAGTAVIGWSLPILAATAALLATHSRGGLLAFLASLGLLSLRARRAGLLWVAGMAAAAALSGLGLERLQDRFSRTSIESLTRTLVWRDSLERSRAFRLAGTGFNTFAAALSSADPWSLPAGATPWPAGESPQEVLGPREGRRSLPEVEGSFWYREAHNDYLQVLIETGVPGLMLALWGAAVVLRRVRHDPWLLAALVGVLLQEFVDFGLQIPALALLFVVLAAMRPRRKAKASGTG
jgi:O-antigen ligase